MKDPLQEGDKNSNTNCILMKKGKKKEGKDGKKKLSNCES